MVNDCSKKITKREQGKAKKKILKSQKPKDVGLFIIQNFPRMLEQTVVKRDASRKKGMLSYCKAFLRRLELIWLISRLKLSKMSRKHVFAKSSSCQWVNDLR